MRRSLTTLFVTSSLLLVLAATALAETDAGHDGGEGWIGETNDKIVTNFGFILIAFFPLFILFASILQHKLDSRKREKLAAAKARHARADVRGGW